MLPNHAIEQESTAVPGLSQRLILMATSAVNSNGRKWLMNCLAPLLASGIISLPALAQSPGQPVMPKQRFPSEILEVHAPDSEGWVLAGSGRNGIAFAKRGAEPGETYGAQVILFELPPGINAGELTDLVKKRISMTNPAPRFQEIASEYQYTEDRGYPCVNVRSSYDDKEAVTPAGKQQLRLKVVALYCRHPVRSELGFFVAYSYRGKTIETQIEAPASSFIGAVNVPR
jgi:hypothetical protein